MRFLYLALLSMFLAAPAFAGTATITVTPPPAWVGDAGVSVECRGSDGSKNVAPGPIPTAGIVFTMTNLPNNGLPPSAKCTAFRGTDAAPTVRSPEASASGVPFPLDPPVLSVK